MSEYDPPKWEPTRIAEDKGADLPLSEAVGRSLGAASACWENLAGAGVFDSTRCGEIYEWLMAYLSDREDKIRKDANEAKSRERPDDRDYVVVTRGRLPHSERSVTHVYGPYGKAKAKSVKSNIRTEHPDVEVSACHVLDPESWRPEG